MTDNRVFSLLPPYLQTEANRKAMSVVDDILFEPTHVEHLIGQIGKRAGVSQTALMSDPFIPVRKLAETQQLSPSIVSADGAGTILEGVFFDDVVNHFKSNGADTSDLNRLFDTPYFVLNVPIDIDMWTNFQRYYWTGSGTSSTTAEYITKDAAHSQTTLYRPDGAGGWTKVIVPYHHGNLPGSGTVGELREHVTAAGRPVKQWTIGGWETVLMSVVDDLPASSTEYATSNLFYVNRYGMNYQRSSFAVWSAEAERWIIKHPIQSTTRPPAAPEGAIWEDSTTGIARTYQVFSGSEWRLLSFSVTTSLTGIGIPDDNDPTVYLIAQTTASEGWISGNWWAHYDDLSPIDQAAYKNQQAFRPIISFWSTIETLGDVKTARHQPPLFEVYSFNDGFEMTPIKEMVSVYNGSTIFEYKRSVTTSIDTVLGFGTVYDTRGEIEFALTIEADTFNDSSSVKGYRFFKDTSTSKYWSVWMRAPDVLTVDETTGIPLNFSHNVDHGIKTDLSRSTLVDHYASVISATSSGAALGSNGYRWSSRDPIRGARLVDAEGSLLKLGFTLTDSDYSIPDAFREAARQYSRFIKRFNRILDELWTNGQNSNPNGTLIGGLTAANLVDRILTNLYGDLDIVRQYSLSDMGTYVNEVTGETRKIICPPSPPRLGIDTVYKPLRFVQEGRLRILCHDGRVVDSFGDDRDLVILEIENRFFNAVPVKRRTETDVSSTWMDQNGFDLRRFVAGRKPLETLPRVHQVVDDYTSLEPDQDMIVYSKNHAVYASYRNGAWTTKSVPNGVLYSIDDAKYFTVTDYNIFEIELFNRFDSDYTVDEFKQVVYRDFDQWRVVRQLDPSSNTTFDTNDRFTWNYSSSGNEGHYRAIYKRIYGTDRPHACPWEVWGFRIKPQWWDSVYSSTSTHAVDGLGRYASTNPMWADLKTGALAAASGIIIPEWMRLHTDAPIPVDVNGELVDPITAGILVLDSVIGVGLDWRYADGAPIEVQYFEAPEGVYASALAAYLMKPARVVDMTWSDYMFAIGDNTVQGGKFLVDDTTFRRTQVTNYIAPGLNNFADPGIGSLITERLSIINKSIKTFEERIRRSFVTLGWRTEGFIDKTTARLTTMSGADIPYEDLFCVLHKSQPFATATHSGVYLVKVGSTYQVFGYDSSVPYFEVDNPEVPIRGGQVIKDEKITATNGQTIFSMNTIRVGTAEAHRFFVLVNGDPVPGQQIELLAENRFSLSNIDINAGDVVTARLHTTTSNSSTRVKSFDAGGSVYTYNDTSSDSTRRVYYGSILNSDAEVIQFLVDYGRRQSQIGWVYEEEDWSDTAKRFALWAQSASDLDVFVDCPSSRMLRFEVIHGYVDDLNKRTSGGGSILDLSMAPAEDLNIMRMDDRIAIGSRDGAFLARLSLVEYQHTVFMSRTTRFNDIIFDEFTGTYHTRLYVNALRTKGWKGRLEAPGYVLSTSGMTPNFETAARDLVGSYDTRPGAAGHMNRDQALSLYNYTVKDYMVKFNLDTKMAFDYHKRAIREKGTSRALMAFTRVKPETTPLEIMECWAWHAGTFGYTSPPRFSASVNSTLMFQRRNVIAFDNAGTDEYQGPLFGAPLDQKWVVPPATSEFTFGKISSNVLVSIIASDVVEGPFEQFYEWDPEAGKHEPLAYKEIDVENNADPATYTNSPNVSFVGSDAWGPDEVGKIWWDTTNRVYAPYRSASTRAGKVAEWGNLQYLSVSDVTALEYGFSANTPTPHGLTVDSSFNVQVKSGEVFQGLVLSVPSDTSMTFVMVDGPESASLTIGGPSVDDFSRIVLGSIDVYEWIEADLSPVQYPTMMGIPYNAANPSWTEITVNGKTKYYFWCKDLKTAGSRHKLSVSTITQRLTNPTTVISPWFARIDDTAIVVDTAPFENRIEVELEFIFTPTRDRVHNEWLIIPETGNSGDFPIEVKSKIYESVTGYDDQFRDIPGLLLPAIQRIGNGPNQSVFPDMAAARRVFLIELNTILRSINRFTSPFFIRAFPDNASFWEYTDYDVLGREVSERVGTVAERNALVDVRNGDCVRVDRVRSPNGVYLFETYRFFDGVWTAIQSQQGTVVVSEDVFDSFYTHITSIETYIGQEMVNRILFTMINEMLRQNPRCDWMFKTSMIDVKLTMNTAQPETIGRDEFKMVSDNINEFKPYHTKVRKFITSHRMLTDEETYDVVEAEITEDPVIKTAVYMDRLSCNLFEEHTFDMEPLDVYGWDFPSWEYERLGTSEWNELGRFTAQEGVNNYTLRNTRSNATMRVRGLSVAGDTVPVPPYTVQYSGKGTNIRFGSVPPVGTIFVAETARTIVSPALLTTVDNIVAGGSSKSTFAHAAVMNQPYLAGTPTAPEFVAGICDDFTGCDDCLAADGGDSEERIRAEAHDYLTIRVTTHNTELYSGFDASPFDYAPLDRALGGHEPKTFYAVYDKGSTANTVTSQNLVTSTLITLTEDMVRAPLFTAALPQYTITHVKYTEDAVTRVLDENEWEPVNGQTIRITCRLKAGGAIRLMYGEIRLLDGECNFTNYNLGHTVSIVDPTHIIFDDIPPDGGSVTVEYAGEVQLDSFVTSAMYSRHQFMVDEMLTNHEIRVDDMSTILVTGYRILNSTDKKVYTWTGSSWSSTTLASGRYVFVRLDQVLVQYDGTNLNVIEEVADDGAGTIPTPGNTVSASVSGCFGAEAATNDPSSVMLAHRIGPSISSLRFLYSDSTGRELDSSRYVQTWSDCIQGRDLVAYGTNPAEDAPPGGSYKAGVKFRGISSSGLHTTTTTDMNTIFNTGGVYLIGFTLDAVADGAIKVINRLGATSRYESRIVGDVGNTFYFEFAYYYDASSQHRLRAGPFNVGEPIYARITYNVATQAWSAVNNKGLPFTATVTPPTTVTTDPSGIFYVGNDASAGTVPFTGVVHLLGLGVQANDNTSQIAFDWENAIT